MKTFTIRRARASRSAVSKETKHRKDAGLREYSVTPTELVRFEKRMGQKIRAERKRGTIKRSSGNLEKDLAD
jgi:hypothetical protein